MSIGHLIVASVVVLTAVIVGSTLLIVWTLNDILDELKKERGETKHENTD